MGILITIAFISAIIVMVVWPLWDEWFKDLESDFNQEGWWNKKD